MMLVQWVLCEKVFLFISIGGAYSNAHDRWGQPSDTFTPGVVQSSMSKARITGTLPVEEVGSSLFSNKPMKSRSKLNPLQFVKGGTSSSQSTYHAQTAPGSSVSASWPLHLEEQPLSSLTSAGSTNSGAASGLSLQTQYAASGSGHLVSTQGGSKSYPAELGVSGQSTSDGLHFSTSQETSGHQSAEKSLPVFSQESISYKSSSAPGATSTSQRSLILLSESLGQRVSSQEEGSYSGLSQGASSRYTPGSLMSNKLYALPIGVSSQSTSAQHSSSGSPSTQSRFGTQLATSSRYDSVQGGSSSSFSHKPQSTLGQYAPLSPTKYVSSPMSSPEVIHSQATSSGTSYRAVSQVGALSQVGASGQFASRRDHYYSGLLPPSQATSSQYGYSKSISSPQSTSSQSADVLSKQYASASQSNSGAQFGSSTGFASQGMSSSNSGSVQSQGTRSQFAPGSQSPYDSLHCKCALSPQGLDREPTTVQSSSKQFTSSYGTQSGSTTPFTLQGSIIYDRSPQPQGTASQLGPVPHTYPSASSPSQGVASQSTTVQGSRKQFTSTFTGDSVTQAGSSTPFTLRGSTTYGGSPQDAASQFVRGWSLPYASLSLSLPQAGQYTTLQGSRKQFTSTFTGGSGTQAGSSAPFILQGSSAYGGSSQPQDAASQLVPGSSPYASVSLSSPQGAASHSSKSYQGYSVSQSREPLKGQPSATRLTPVIRTADASASQHGSSSQSSPMQLSSLSSAGGSSRVSGQFVPAHGGSNSYGGSFQSPSLSTKYTPGFHHLPFYTGVAGQGTASASASEVLSSYSSMKNLNAPAQPSRRSSSSRFYSVKG